jgi:hypothetical protein
MWFRTVFTDPQTQNWQIIVLVAFRPSKRSLFLHPVYWFDVWFFDRLSICLFFAFVSSRNKFLEFYSLLCVIFLMLVHADCLQKLRHFFQDCCVLSLRKLVAPPSEETVSVSANWGISHMRKQKISLKSLLWKLFPLKARTPNARKCVCCHIH